MNILRRRSLQFSALAMIATTVAGGISLSAQAATTPTAATVIAAATKSLAKEIGVHIAVATDDNKVLSSVVADIGKTSGYETYKKGGETFTISVTPTYAYLSGSKTGLTSLMGLTTTEAKKVGLQVHRHQEGFDSVHDVQDQLDVRRILSVASRGEGYDAARCARQGNGRLPAHLDDGRDARHRRRRACL